MTLSPLSSPSRVVSLETGLVMVVTDLHGDWDTYRRYRDRFLALHAQGEVHYLVLAGDLIHSDGPPADDHSLDMVLDVLRLQAEIGADHVIYLLGNHELPHIYGITLQKGQHIYTPRFEAALGRHRAAVSALFDALPFYVRTWAGVSICHAGAAAEARHPEVAARLFQYSHRRVLDEVKASLPLEQRGSLRRAVSNFAGEPYDDMARRYLAVTGPDDARYDDLLVGYFASTHADFELLWAAFFTTNERDEGARAYAVSVRALLDNLSQAYQPQQLLVAGHIGCRGGYALVGERQLRLASGSHARPPEKGLYLLFDPARPVSRDGLVGQLGSVFT